MKNLIVKRNHIRSISTASVLHCNAATPSAPVVPAKVYENSDTQKLELLKESSGKTAVYMWTNRLTGKRYIGSAQNLKRRLLQYFNVSHIARDLSMFIHRALLKYGYSNFSLTILEYCDLDVLLEREQHYIDSLKPEYNICPTAGSTLGKLHSEKAKLKISTTKKGSGVGESNSMYGKVHTEEAIKKMSEAKLGRTLSDELKAKLSKAAMGRKFTNEHLANMAVSRKNSLKLGVLDLQTGIETTYPSISAAMRELNIPASSITSWIKSESQDPYKDRYAFKILDNLADSSLGDKHFYGKVNIEEVKAKISEAGMAASKGGV